MSEDRNGVANQCTKMLIYSSTIQNPVQPNIMNGTEKLNDVPGIEESAKLINNLVSGTRLR